MLLLLSQWKTSYPSHRRTADQFGGEALLQQLCPGWAEGCPALQQPRARMVHTTGTTDFLTLSSFIHSFCCKLKCILIMLLPEALWKSGLAVTCNLPEWLDGWHCHRWSFPEEGALVQNLMSLLLEQCLHSLFFIPVLQCNFNRHHWISIPDEFCLFFCLNYLMVLLWDCIADIIRREQRCLNVHTFIRQKEIMQTSTDSSSIFSLCSLQLMTLWLWFLFYWVLLWVWVVVPSLTLNKNFRPSHLL